MCIVWPEEGLKETDCLNQILMTHSYRSSSHPANTFVTHAARAHIHIICFPNTPTHTFAHRAARHWVFLNTVLLGSLLYNKCLRDIQRLSDLFNVTVGIICPHPGTTHYCPSTGRKHACGENISLYLHCTLYTNISQVCWINPMNPPGEELLANV